MQLNQANNTYNIYTQSVVCLKSLGTIYYKIVIYISHSLDLKPTIAHRLKCQGYQDHMNMLIIE